MKKIFFVNKWGLKLCGILETSNPHSKEVVVMVHGYSSGKDRSTYVMSEAALAAVNMNSFRFDLAGNYESEGKFEEQTISTMVEDIEASVEMLQKRGFEVFDFIGSSGGGLAAMAYALKHRVHKLALIAPVSDYVSQRKLQYGEAALKQWKEKGYTFYDAGPRGLLKVNYSFFEDAKQYNMCDKASGIKCPVLICHGDLDAQVPLEYSEKLVKLLPNAELKIFKGVGHFFQDKVQKKQLVGLIADWLARKP